jgi:hypothetical protein
LGKSDDIYLFVAFSSSAFVLHSEERSFRVHMRDDSILDTEKAYLLRLSISLSNLSHCRSFNSQCLGFTLTTTSFATLTSTEDCHLVSAPVAHSDRRVVTVTRQVDPPACSGWRSQGVGLGVTEFQGLRHGRHRLREPVVACTEQVQKRKRTPLGLEFDVVDFDERS